MTGAGTYPTSTCGGSTRQSEFPASRSDDRLLRAVIGTACDPRSGPGVEHYPWR